MNPRQNSSNQSNYYGGGNNYTSSQNSQFSSTGQGYGYSGGSHNQSQRGGNYGGYSSGSSQGGGGYNQGGNTGSGGNGSYYGNGDSSSYHNQNNNNNQSQNHQQQNQHQFNPSGGYTNSHSQNQYKSYSNMDGHADARQSNNRDGESYKNNNYNQGGSGYSGGGYNQYGGGGGGYQNYSNSYSNNYNRQSDHSQSYQNSYSGQYNQNPSGGGNYYQPKQQVQSNQYQDRSSFQGQQNQTLNQPSHQGVSKPQDGSSSNAQMSKKQKQTQAKLQQMNKEKETQKQNQQKLKQQTQEQQKTIQKQNILIKEQEMNLHRLQEQFKEKQSSSTQKSLNDEQSTSIVKSNHEETKQQHSDSRVSGLSSQKSLGEEVLKQDQEQLEEDQIPPEKSNSDLQADSFLRADSIASDKIQQHSNPEIQIESLQKSSDSKDINQGNGSSTDLKNIDGMSIKSSNENQGARVGMIQMQNQSQQNNSRVKASMNGDAQVYMNEEGFQSPQMQGSRSDTYYRKIFVGGLPHNLQDEEFKAYFLQYGDIEDCAILKDKRTGKPRGFGFVTYRTIQQVDFVMGMKDSHYIQGKWVDCKRAVPASLLKKDTPDVDSLSQGLQSLKIQNSSGAPLDNQSNSQNNSSNDHSDTSLTKQQQLQPNYSSPNLQEGINNNLGYAQTHQGASIAFQNMNNGQQQYSQGPSQGQQNFQQNQGYYPNPNSNPFQGQNQQNQSSNMYQFNQPANQHGNQMGLGNGMMSPEMMQNLQSIIRNTILQNPQLLSGPNTDINMLVSQIGTQLILSGGVNFLSALNQQNTPYVNNNQTPGGPNQAFNQGQQTNVGSFQQQQQQPYMQTNQFNQYGNQQNQFQQQQQYNQSNQQFSQNTSYPTQQWTQGGNQYMQNQGNPNANIYGQHQQLNNYGQQQSNNQTNQGQPGFYNQGLQSQQKYAGQSNKTPNPASPLISSQSNQGVPQQQMNFNQVLPNSNALNLSPIQNPKKMSEGMNSASVPFKPQNQHQRQNSNNAGSQQENPMIVFRDNFSHGPPQGRQDSSQPNSNYISQGASPMYQNNQRQLNQAPVQNMQFGNYVQTSNQQQIGNAQHQQRNDANEASDNSNQRQFKFSQSPLMVPLQQQQFQNINQVKVDGVKQNFGEGYGMMNQQFHQGLTPGSSIQDGQRFNQNQQQQFNQFAQGNQGGFNMMQGSFNNQALNHMSQQQDQNAEQLLKQGLQNPNESGDFPCNQEKTQGERQSRQSAMNLQRQFQNLEKQEQIINIPNPPSPINKASNPEHQINQKEIENQSANQNNLNQNQPLSLNNQQIMQDKEQKSQAQTYQPAYLGQLAGFPSFQYAGGAQPTGNQFKSGFPYSDSFKLQQQMQEQMNNSMSFSLGFGQINQSMNMSIDSIGKKHQEQTEWYIQSLQKQFETSFTDDRIISLDQLNETQNRLKGDTISGINQEIRRIQQRGVREQEKNQNEIIAKADWSPNSRPNQNLEQNQQTPDASTQARNNHEEEKQSYQQNSFNFENQNAQIKQGQTYGANIYQNEQQQQLITPQSYSIRQDINNPNFMEQNLNESMISAGDPNQQKDFMTFKFAGFTQDHANMTANKSQNSSASLKTPQPQDDLSFNLKNDPEHNISLNNKEESEHIKQDQLDLLPNHSSESQLQSQAPAQYNYVSKYNPFGAPSTTSYIQHNQINPYQQASQSVPDQNSGTKKRPPSQNQNTQISNSSLQQQNIQRQQSQGNLNLLNQSATQEQPRRYILASGENFEFGKDRPSSRSSQDKDRKQNFGSSFYKSEYGQIKSEQKQGPSNRADRNYKPY